MFEPTAYHLLKSKTVTNKLFDKKKWTQDLKFVSLTTTKYNLVKYFC